MQTFFLDVKQLFFRPLCWLIRLFRVCLKYLLQIKLRFH